MASNYFPVSLLEQPWDDDQIGTLSSLERRQRKAAEKQDVNAFYKLLGVVFVTLNLVLLGSELYTFAVEPSRGLTGAFLLELGRMAGVAYVQLQSLYKAIGDVAWTGIAVVHGHDFAQRGVSIAEGVAQLLASGLYYLALALSVLVMYYVYPCVSRAPLRTAALSTVAAGALFGAPPVYAWLVSRLCHTRSPEPVVLWALLFGAIMCWASISTARAISGRSGEGPHAHSSALRHRNVPAPRRQAAAGPAAGQTGTAGGGGGSAAAAAAGGISGVAAGGGGNSAASTAGAPKRNSYSRASSSGRSGGAAAPGDLTQPSVARSGSSASLSGLGGVLAGLSCLSGHTGTATDPVGIHASARGLHGGGGSCCSNPIDPVASSSTTSCLNAKQGSSAAANGRGGGRPGQSGAASAFDPVAVSGKLCGNASSRGSGSTGPSTGAGNNTSSGTSSGSASAAAATAKGSASHSSKQRQQPGGSCGAAGGGADGGSAAGRAKQSSGSAPVSTQTRSSLPDQVAAISGAGGGSKTVAGSHSAGSKQHLTDPVAVPSAAPSSSLAAASKKKASNSASSSSGINASAAFASTPSAATAAAVVTARQPQGTASAGAPGAAAAGANAASKPLRPEAAKLSGGGVTATSSPGPASQGNGAHANGGTVVTGPAAAGAAAAAGAFSAGGLLYRLAGSVASAATSTAPALSNRAAKKAAAAAGTRKPPSQPQYIIVPPPPPPPRRAQPATATADTAAGAASAVGAAAAAAASAGNPVRNAWLSPNPVIKVAAGVAKGAARPATPSPAAAPAVSTVPVSRSGGGTATHFGGASPPTPSSARSASYGGAGAGGGFSGGGGAALTSADPPVFDGYIGAGSPRASSSRPPLFVDATATVAAAPPRGAGAIGGPIIAAAPPPPPPPLTVPASAFLPPLTREQLRNHIQGSIAGANGETLISTTFVSSDASVGPLVAHKHASGDLDIAHVAANYRPYPSSVPPAPGMPPQRTAPAIDADSTDSFSLFSTPPPLITAEAVIDPAAAAAAGGLAAADAGAPRGAQLMYGMYSGYGHYAALPSLSGDPVWSHNVPSVFGAAAGLSGVRAPRVPPPGFPSHAYGGAFAAGPIPGGGGWEHPAAVAAAAVAANGPPDAVPPLPPAVENGVLASLGFVDDDGGANSSTTSGGGGEDAGASCAICWSAPRQVGFLHGKTSHLCVCRRCAAKLREGVHRCPMCRQLIERIIDIY